MKNPLSEMCLDGPSPPGIDDAAYNRYALAPASSNIKFETQTTVYLLQGVAQIALRKICGFVPAEGAIAQALLQFKLIVYRDQKVCSEYLPATKRGRKKACSSEFASLQVFCKS
jgi:hypothetical protein